MKQEQTVAGAEIVLFGLLLLAGAGCSKKNEPNYGDAMVDALRRGHIQAVRGHMETLSVAITSYVTQTGNLPTAADINELADLLEPSYVRVSPRQDPWGHAYEWSSDGNSWTLRCIGQDGISGNNDDLEMVDGQVTKLPAGMTRL